MAATKSAFRGSQSAVPATKSALRGSQSAVPATKSAKNLHFGVHKVLCLPRNLHFDVHQLLLCLPQQQQNLHFEVHRVLCLPRNVHFEVHKELRLPQNLQASHMSKGHVTIHGTCHDISAPPRSPPCQSAVPATKSAFRNKTAPIPGACHNLGSCCCCTRVACAPNLNPSTSGFAKVCQQGMGNVLQGSLPAKPAWCDAKAKIVWPQFRGHCPKQVGHPPCPSSQKSSPL